MLPSDYIYLLIVLLAFGYGDCRSANSDVKHRVDQQLRRHRVVMFSKTWCKHSKNLKTLLANYSIPFLCVIELDQDMQGLEIQMYLSSLSGRTTVPQLFVGGRFIGGDSETALFESTGSFDAIMQTAGARRNKLPSTSSNHALQTGCMLL